MARRIVITDHALDRFAEPHPERGFRIVGQVPGAFRHRERGATDVYIMHRFL